MGLIFFSYGYFVGPKFFSWVFHGSKFFLVGISWVQFFFSRLISWFKDFQLLAAWERVAENRNKYNSNRLCYSKSISIISSSVCIRKILHLLSFVLFYFLVIASVLGSLHCNNDRLLLQNYLHYFFTDNYSNFLIANSPYFPTGKNPYILFNFGPIRRSKTLSFRGSEHSPNFQF